MFTPSEIVAQAGQFGGADLAQQRGTLAELAQICQAWGAAIATLHTISTRRLPASLAPRPRVLSPRRLMPSMRDVAGGSGYAAVLEAYESSPDLRAAAIEVDQRWTEQHWIHGNLSASTVMVEEQPALRVSFLDLESGGLGDPAWDLASAVDTITWLSPRWHAVAQPLVDYLILGYRRAGGPGRLYPAIQAVRALATAVWVAESTGGTDRARGSGRTGTLAGPGPGVRRARRMVDGCRLVTDARRQQLQASTVVPRRRPMRKVAASASAPPTNTRTVGRSKGLPPRYPPAAPVIARAMRTATKVAGIRSRGRKDDHG